MSPPILPSNPADPSARNPLYRVVLVEDDAVFRHSLKHILQENQKIIVAGEAGDGLELLEFLESAASPPDLAIVDISMPRLGGIEATIQAKRVYPGMKVLILSMHREKEYIRAARAAGADGYVLKDCADIELFAAIEKIRHGGTYISLLLNKEDA